MSDKVIAKPSEACCLRGKIHTGDPKGNIVEIEGVETYVSEPPAGKANGNVLLYFPDVYGLFINGKLIMDAFAAAGYLTLGPDYFRGDPVYKHSTNPTDPNANPEFDFGAWLAKHQAFSDPFVPKWVDAVKQMYGKADTKFACTGYCYGAPYVMQQLVEGGICTAGAFAHPAFLKESHFENLTKPLFLSCAEIDQTFPKEFRRRAVDIMDEKKQVYHVQLFQGVSHGFALRSDMEDPVQKYAKDASIEGMAGWFDHWSSK